MSEIPSRQEMFNRAWKGLKSQGWRKSVGNNGSCRYVGYGGERCAWGWVDPEGTSDADGYGHVVALHSAEIGLAARLTGDDLAWASDLQIAHDTAVTPAIMQQAMRAFAQRHGLTIQEDDDV